MLKYQNSFMRVYDFTDIGFGETVVMFRSVRGEDHCVKICSNVNYDLRAFNLELTLGYHDEDSMFDNIGCFTEDFLKEFLSEMMPSIQKAIVSGNDISLYITNPENTQE